MTTKPMVVNGVNMGAAKMPLVEAALVRRSLPVGGTDAQKVGRLVAWYAAHTPKNRIADCSTCGGESDVEEPACPFCGDGESEAAPAPASMTGTSGKVASAPPTSPAKPVPPSAAGLVRYEKPKPATGLVSAPVAEVVARAPSEAALDDAVAGIGVLMQSAADRLWELGAAIRDVFDTGLWGQRKSEDGAAKYKAWGQFCEAELGISHGYSLKLMDVAREFSRDQVRKIGASKLHITLAVPKGEARDRLLGIAPTTSKVDLAKLAETEKKALDAPARDTGRGKKGGAGTHKGGPAKSGGRKPEKITVAMLTNRVELTPLTVDGKKGKLKITHPFIAEERLFNGVKQRIVVTNDEEGFLLLVIERVRE
jgi:hypothetical protein